MPNVTADRSARFIEEVSHLSGAPSAVLAQVCSMLRRAFPHYNWVGVYVVEGEMLRLEAWDGREPTEHVLIQISRGLCGMAVREDRTVTVGDVDSSPEYLACFPYTKSEIVVPVRHATRVVGEIDIDGDKAHAYDDSDREFLEALGRAISGTVLSRAEPAKPKAV